MRFHTLTLLLLCPLTLPGCTIDLTYPVYVREDPLINPVKVSSIDGKTLTLEDGRKLVVMPFYNGTETEEVFRMIKQSGHRIDLERNDEDMAAFHEIGVLPELSEDALHLYVQNDMSLAYRHGGCCDTPTLRIPLFPKETNELKRQWAGAVVPVSPQFIEVQVSAANEP